MAPVLDYLQSIAQYHARRLGLTGDALEDCAAEFVLHALLHQQTVLRSELPDPELRAWLNRCASNFARNYVRGLTRRRIREAPCAVYDPAGEADLNVRDPHVQVVRHWMRSELSSILEAALLRLPGESRELLLLHHVEGLPVTELAAARDRSPAAIAQALARARRRLKSALERRGIDEVRLGHYLC